MDPDRWVVYGIMFAVLLIVLFLMGEIQQRRFRTKLEQRLREARASLEETRQFQRESAARVTETQARGDRAMEIAEQALHDRQEMLSLLRRILDAMESRRH